MIPIIRQDDRLIVTSLVIAEELQIEHKNLLESIRKYQEPIESNFGRVTFKTLSLETRGGMQQITLVDLTEDQATFLLTLSRNTPKVVDTKARLVKAFSEAKSKLQGTSTLDNDLVAALMVRLQKMDAVIEVSQEYLSLRKYADQILPGLNQLIESLIETRFVLAPVRIEFTAPEWIEVYAPEFNERQRRVFFRAISYVHKFLVGDELKKCQGKYLYTNRHQILFERTKSLVEKGDY